MTIPPFQAVMRPALDCLSDGVDRRVEVIREEVADALGITPEERAELLPSGKGKRFGNRVYWALIYLNQARAVERPKPATYRITTRGRDLLASHPDSVGVDALKAFPEFIEFRHRHKNTESASVSEESDGGPVESMEQAVSEIESALATELLARIMESSPTFFEHLVLDLLVAMGFGGDPSMLQHIGGSGDGGVDGVIDEDRLGLDQVYVQAKRWSNPVGRREIQGFVGALEGKRAMKGVFITTSSFNQNAADYVRGLSRRVVLIDGARLGELLVRHGVGVQTRLAFEVKELDESYFEED